MIPPRDPAIARLERTVDCQWTTARYRRRLVRNGPRTRPTLTGRALIRFESGAEVLLEGPAVFQLNDPLHGELLGGQLVARVPSEASGFTIQTPTATVRDLGTEFGVVADAHGGTEVHVFAGQVELLSPAINAGEVVLLREGQARRLETSHEHGKANWQILPVNQARFALDVDRPTLPLPVEGELLLADDFRGDTLDPSNWRVVTEGVPSGRATVRMENGKLELVNRGHLVTRHQFVPGAGGDLRIRGRFTLASPLDMLQVLTRSDGRPRHDSYGDTTTGIECFVNMDAGGVIGIYGRGEVRLRETIALLEIEQGETFDFELLDTGQTVTFTVRKVGGDGASATVSTYCDQRTDDNFVVLHNRERTRIDRVTEVDHVMIERITTDPLLRETNHEQVADEGE